MLAMRIAFRPVLFSFIATFAVYPGERLAYVPPDAVNAGARAAGRTRKIRRSEPAELSAGPARLDTVAGGAKLQANSAIESARLAPKRAGHRHRRLRPIGAGQSRSLRSLQTGEESLVARWSRAGKHRRKGQESYSQNGKRHEVLQHSQSSSRCYCVTSNIQRKASNPQVQVSRVPPGVPRKPFTGLLAASTIEEPGTSAGASVLGIRLPGPAGRRPAAPRKAQGACV